MATNDKYDRQLRLWGAQGQRALGETRVVCVGTSSAGTETLKNLVLPGVGAFTVMDFVDDNSGGITDQDASSNFFLPKEESTKAEGASKYLKELNPDVRGSYRNLSLSNEEEEDNHSKGGPDTPVYWKDILEEESLRKDDDADDETNDAGDTDTAMAAAEDAKKKSLLVIASDVIPSILEALADACWESGYPLVVVSSYGLIGTVRLQLPKKGSVLLQPKPTNSPPDLRLVTSFPAFSDFVDSVAGGDLLETMDSQQHGHVPYPVLLAKAMQKYREAKSCAASMDEKLLPKTFCEKQDFVNNYVKPMARDFDKEVNFQEAVSNAYLAYTERDLALDTITDKVITKESKLGQLKAALDTFVQEHPDHRPPLNGSVPDMTASTGLYVRLQQLYKQQAEEDLSKLTEILRKQQQEQRADEWETVTDEDIMNFCANVYSVGHIRTRSLREEYHGDNAAEEELVDDWKMALMDPYEVPVHTPFLWYLGVRAAQIFCQKHGRYPGCVVATSGDDKTESLGRDAALLSEIYKTTVISHYQLGDQELVSSSDHVDSICKELTRYGNAEIHTIASVIGGVASQEAVKIVTGQYVPLDNTYIYNGIVSVAGVYKF